MVDERKIVEVECVSLSMINFKIFIKNKVSLSKLLKWAEELYASLVTEISLVGD